MNSLLARQWDVRTVIFVLFGRLFSGILSLRQETVRSIDLVDGRCRCHCLMAVTTQCTFRRVSGLLRAWSNMITTRQDPVAKHKNCHRLTATVAFWGVCDLCKDSKGGKERRS
jgi:hypothetical protein